MIGGFFALHFMNQLYSPLFTRPLTSLSKAGVSIPTSPFGHPWDSQSTFLSRALESLVGAASEAVSSIMVSDAWPEGIWCLSGGWTFTPCPTILLSSVSFLQGLLTLNCDNYS